MVSLDDRELYRWLVRIDDDPGSGAPLRELKLRRGLSADDDSLERRMLLLGVEQAVPKIADLPVHPQVKKSLESEIRGLSTATGPLTVGSQSFTRAAKLATLRRFPAGPMEWEMSGVPRSWLLRVRGSDLVRLPIFLATRLRGFRPCFFMHVAPRPRSLALAIEQEVMRSYYRMARSLALQPGRLGIVAMAWFYDPKAVADNPHLEPLSRPFLNSGGAIFLLGEAGPESGVLDGSEKRRWLYEQGRLHYRYGLAIWPRAAALGWADAHPEYDS